jgi:hypothetical protein
LAQVRSCFLLYRTRCLTAIEHVKLAVLLLATVIAHEVAKPYLLVLKKVLGGPLSEREHYGAVAGSASPCATAQVPQIQA